MSRKNHQKVKVMIIYDILRRETDETHPMSTVELIDKLAERGIPAERKSLYEDIKLLNAYGYEVLTEREKANMYYVVDRNFDIAELRVLMDAVQSASFITARKTEALIEKIAALAGAHRAEVLKKNIVCFNTAKHTNEKIFYWVDTLDSCILEGKKCSFEYFDYDFEGRRVYRKDKEPYIVNPIALMYNEDNYYLLAYGDKYENVAVYRVDRMENVTECGEGVTGASWLDPSEIALYRRRAFSMFSGKTTEVVLVCDKSAIDVMVDQFGERINMLNIDDNTCRIRTQIQVSPTFFGWLTTLGGKVRIDSPAEVKEEYRAHLLKCLAAEERTSDGESVKSEEAKEENEPVEVGRNKRRSSSRKQALH